VAVAGQVGPINSTSPLTRRVMSITFANHHTIPPPCSPPHQSFFQASLATALIQFRLDYS